MLEQVLLRRLCDRVDQHYAVLAALEIFGNNQAWIVREVARHIGLSQRRFIQIFKAEVGVTPKLFSRIQRFQQTRSFIQQSASVNWATLALELGYFDQSHLIREFLEFSGQSPTNYRKRQIRFLEQNIQLERNRRSN